LKDRLRQRDVVQYSPFDKVNPQGGVAGANLVKRSALSMAWN